MADEKNVTTVGEFVHLRVRTEYSLMDSLIGISQLVGRVATLGMPAVAVTDRDVMHGAAELHEAAREAGIKPIFGLELSVAGEADAEEPLVLLAKDADGYRNLLRLSTAVCSGAPGDKRQIDRALLRAHAGGLIAIAGDIAGEVARKAMGGDEAGAQAAAAELGGIFGAGNLYLQVVAVGLPEQDRANRALAELSRRAGIPLVATNDCRYLFSREAEAHQILRCIKAKKRLSDQPHGPVAQHHFRTPGEMASIFANFPEALRATVEIASRCAVDLPSGQLHVPSVSLPAGSTGRETLARLAEEGLARRLGSAAEVSTRQRYEERLAHELSVVDQQGLAGYFLTLEEIVSFARASDILVGPGRGTAPGSLLLYALGVTDVDPMVHGLFFEPFFDPSRQRIPDVDLDFEICGRDRIIDHVRQVHGADRVAGLVTFGHLSHKGAFLDAARVLGVPLEKAHSIAGGYFGLRWFTDTVPADPVSRAPMCDLNDPVVQRLSEVAFDLEKLRCCLDSHSSGVIISPKTLADLAPLFPHRDGFPLVQYDEESCEQMGLMKVDFLGFETLDLIHAAEKGINGRSSQTAPFSIADIPFDDLATFDLLGTGLTTGVFGLESQGIRELLVKMRPQTFDDLVALHALYRPGPMLGGIIDLFLDRRRNRSAIEYPHLVIRKILEPTYGLPIYREQIMHVAVAVAGYSPSDANQFREQIRRKRQDPLRQEKEKFIAGAIARHGFSADLAEEVFSALLYYSGYNPFLKAHAVAYTMLTYRTAWLKAHHPRELLDALRTMCSYFGESDQSKSTIARFELECAHESEET